jgi:hypothetical protein
MEPSRTTTYRWVAGRGDARAATRALFVHVLRTRGIWVVLAMAALFFAVLIVTGGESLAVAVVWGIVYAALLEGFMLGLLYLVTRRRLARQLRPGLVLESEFGPDHVVLRGPWTESRIAFAGIDQIRRTGAWVLMRQRRSRLVSCWPAALFPSEELARLETAVAGHS